MEVHMFQPRTLTEAITLARRKETSIETVKRSKNRTNWGPTSPTSSNFLPNSQKTSILGPPPNYRINQDKIVPIKRLTPAEMESRRKQDLYYFCDEKFTLGHKCRLKQLYIITGEEEEDNEQIEDIIETISEKAKNAMEKSQCML